MRILMVGHSYVVALNRRLCRAVAEAGDGSQVTVAAPAFFHGDLRPISLEDRADEPFTLVPIPTRWTRVAHLFHYGNRLRKLAREGGWDVIHAWGEPYTVSGAQVASVTPRGAALVYSTFQNLPKRYPPPFAQIESYCLRRASGWTAFGRTVEENLRDRPLYRDRPRRTIPLGIDAQVFRPDPEAGARIRARLGWESDGPPVIGFVGRFVPEKGLHLLMRVLDRLDAGCWRALLVGGGALEAELRAWAARHTESVRIATGITHDEMPPYYNAMDLLAAPSQTLPRWKEQLGRMLLEAMASGVATLGSDSGEIPYVLDDAGRVLPEADEDAWLDALRELLESPERRRDLAARGLDRARQRFDWSRIGREFLDFFQEVRSVRA